MQVKQSSGLTSDDVMDIKVFLRTYNDAIECAHSIAKRDTQVSHYKAYVKALIKSIKTDQVFDDWDQCSIDDYR